MSAAHSTLLLLVSAVLLAGLAQAARQPGDDLDRDLSIIKKCNSSSPVSKDIMNSVLINRILLDQNHYGFKCFLHCVYMEYGWMERHGAFRREAIKEFLRGTRLPPRTMRRLLDMCTFTESKDKCERAYDYTQCFWGEMKKPQMDDSDDLLDEYEPLIRNARLEDDE